MSEALKMLRDESVPPDRRIILLDLNMPRMGGIEFLRELRADPALRSSSVIVLTTSDEDRDRVDAYNLNVAGYLLKPVTLPAFMEHHGDVEPVLEFERACPNSLFLRQTHHHARCHHRRGFHPKHCSSQSRPNKTPAIHPLDFTVAPSAFRPRSAV